MGQRIVNAIGWLLMEFEARMVTLMIWLCWICGITTDEIKRVRDEQDHRHGPAPRNDNRQLPPEPRLPSKTAPRHKRSL